MIIEFVVHVVTPDDAVKVKTELTHFWKDYLFERGEPWFRTPKSSFDKLKVAGVLDCRDNVENGHVIIQALTKVTGEIKLSVGRIIDRSHDQDFLLEESESDRSEQKEVVVAQSAFMINASLCIVSGMDELRAVKALREKADLYFDTGRTTFLLNRIGNIDSLMRNSRHFANVMLPPRAAWILLQAPELVPMCVYSGMDELLDDSQTKLYHGLLLDDMQDQRRIRLRFTRLAYATMRRQCDSDSIDQTSVIVQGLARLIRSNDDYETALRQKFRDVTPIDHSIRKSVFGTQSFDDEWPTYKSFVSWMQTTKREIPREIDSETPNDDDTWLIEEPNEGVDISETEIDDELQELQASLDHELNISKSDIKGPLAPITFSSTDFMRLLGSDSVDRDST